MEIGLRTPRSHVSVIGAGNVGSATVNALAASKIPLRIVLLDRTRAKAEGQCWDAEDALALTADHHMLATDDYADVAGSDVVIITAGSRNLPGESRLALTERNAATVRSIVEPARRRRTERGHHRGDEPGRRDDPHRHRDLAAS